MKKLMIAACAVAFAAAAHAAAWEWGWMNGASGVYAAGTENQLIGSTAYLFDADAVSQQTVLSAFLGGGSLSGYIAGANGTTDDGIVMSDANFAYTATGTGPVEDATYLHSYYAIVDGDNIFFSETAETVQLSFGEIGIEFDDVKSVSQAAANTTGSFSGAGWYTAAAAPEPTSGLLLLLGVAGLALRRRRA